jgi:hypothetical protein
VRCEFCDILLEILTTPFDDRIPRSEVGRVSDIVSNSKCDVHPRIILALFGEAFHEKRFETIEVVKRKKFIYTTVILCLRSDDQHLGSFEGREIFLAAPEHVAQTLGCRTIMDSDWIDGRMLIRWKSTCDNRHHAHANQSLKIWDRAPGPTFLIDTVDECLVKGDEAKSYIALSYVWGKDSFYHTSKHDLARLFQPHAFTADTSSQSLPRTIIDVFGVVKLLGERYLWVDALCIPQDDVVMKQREINNMAAIYTKATLTIIAAQGSDANFGLRGVRGASRERSFATRGESFSFGSHIIPYHSVSEKLWAVPWSSRGWTFQEYLLSRRMLVFIEGTAFFQCSDTVWEENTDHGSDTPNWRRDEAVSWFKLTVDRMPDSFRLGELIRSYNARTLTHSEDIFNAFEGLASALTASCFPEGFLCGMPITYFSIFLLWQPHSATRRRTSSNPTAAKAIFPSWSWMGWQDKLYNHAILFENDFVKRYASTGSDEKWLVERTILPIVQWYAHETRQSHRIPISNSWYKLREKYLNKQEEPPPPHWHRHEYIEHEQAEHGDSTGLHPRDIVPRWFYTNDFSPGSEYWYPIPLPDSSTTGKHSTNVRFLSCRAQRSYLNLGERRFEAEVYTHRILRDDKSRWAGMVMMHRDADAEDWMSSPMIGSEYLTNETVELVAVSEGWAYDDYFSGNGAPLLDDKVMGELDDPERPLTGEQYKFYDVLCVEWKDDVAYRTGLGRVQKEAWERQKLEWIDLTLG